jgi:hypothetical protein
MTGVDDYLEDFSDYEKIAFPNVRSWKIIGHFGFLQYLDLSCAHTLDLESLTYPLDPMDVAFSTQLTNLVLRMVAFTYNSRPNGQPQLLPRLKNLELENVIVQGFLQDHMICPELETLSFRYAPDKVDPGLVNIGFEVEISHRLWEVFNEAFFQGVPNLKFVSVLGLSLDSFFLSNLQPCTVLETLVVEECSIQDLIPHFLEYLIKLPSLTAVRIDDSWPQHLNISYREFIKSCVAEKPGMYIYGNGRVRI